MLNLVLAFYGTRKLGVSKLRGLFKSTQPIKTTHTQTHAHIRDVQMFSPNHEEHKTDFLVTTLERAGSPVSSSWK